MRQDRRFVWLDLARGLCAIAVCAGHLRSAILVDHSSLSSSSLMQKAFYLATGFGHQAVMVFFVLSGLFVGGAVLRSRDNFDWKKYSIARLSRLWVVLIPALLITALIDFWIANHAPQVLSGSYRAVWNSGPSPQEPYSSSAATFVLNLLFLQTIAAPVFGTNGPLWSLANEFWYYTLLPLCVLTVSGRPGGRTLSWPARSAMGLLSVVIFLALPAEIRGGYFVWLLGLIVYYFTDKLDLTTTRVVTGIGVVLFGAALMYSKASSLQAILLIPSDFAVASAFCLLCIGLANLSNQSTVPQLLAKLAHASSEFSYSLYLLHFPVVILIATLFYGTDKLAPDANGLLQFFMWLGLLLLICAMFWWLFERRTNAVRRWVTLRLEKRPLVRAESI